jgi:hypothetical protein
MAEIIAQEIVTTHTEKYAAFGLPAPSSLLTLTLAAALNPTEIMNTQPEIVMLHQRQTMQVITNSKLLVKLIVSKHYTITIFVFLIDDADKF